MALDESTSNNNNGDATATNARRKRKRWGAAVNGSETAATTTTSSKPDAAAPLLDAKAKLLAQQESIRARLAAAKARVLQPSTTSTIAGTRTSNNVGHSLPGASQKSNAAPPLPSSTSKNQNQTDNARSSARRPTSDIFIQPPAKKAKVYDLDLSITGPSFKEQQQMRQKSQDGSVASEQTRKITNPYLAHLEELDDRKPPFVKRDKKDGGYNAKTEADDSTNIQNLDSEVDTTAAVAKTDELEPADDVDDRLARASKPRLRNKALTFVEPGMWQEKAERQRANAATAQLYLSGRKNGHSVSAIGMGAENIYGPSSGGSEAKAAEERIEVQERNQAPLVLEWWDMELLPSKLKKQVAAAESNQWNKNSKAALLSVDKKIKVEGDVVMDGSDADGTTNDAHESIRQQCYSQFSITNSKTSLLVQHIVPIKPPHAQNSDTTGPQPTIYLTKKELKRQRKLRRQEKQRELQDLQAAGLIAAPEPRLTLQNFIQVMGDQAYLDPSQMEHKVQQQIQARQRAHQERNQSKKLTKEQRAAKLAAKLQEDTRQGVHVALFWAKDMSHPYHRAKVDLNAQQSYISGGVVECQDPALACVICEGGPKAIKRFKRLMLVRMSWTGPKDGLDDESSEDEEPDDASDGAMMTRKFSPDNACELVWEGMSAKRFFNSFVFQAVDTSSQARKVLKGKGVGHYWDQVIQHASGVGKGFQLRLADNDSDDDDNPYKSSANEGDDVVMKEE